MPTKNQLFRIWETEFEFPQTRREDDPMHQPSQRIKQTGRQVDTPDNSLTRGELYSVADDYTYKFKTHWGKNLQKIVGKDLLYKNDGIAWQWNHELLKKMTILELQNLINKIKSKSELKQ